MKFRIDKKKDLMILEEADRIELHQLKLHLTRHVKNYKFQPRFKMGLWDGKISHYNDGMINIGLWKEIYTLCKRQDWKFKITNKEDFPIDKEIKYEDVVDWCKTFFKNHTLKDGKPFMPYDHQMQSAYKILKNRFCLTEVATGGGKSLIFAIVTFYTLAKINPDAKFLLIVPNISLVTQFYDDLLDYNLGFNNENPDTLDLRMEEIMSDKPRRNEEEANIFIGTIQSLEKRDAKWFKQFYSITTDEAHKSSNKSSASGIKQVTKVLKRTFGSAHLRYGMSGTFPEETTIDYLSIQSLHGPKIGEVQAKELMDKGIITPVKIKTVILNHNDELFNDNINLVRKGGNGRVCFDLERKYIQESKKRLDFVVEKILTKIKSNTLVLFNIKDYGKKIYDACRTNLKDVDVYYIDGDTKSDKRKYIKEQMEDTSGNVKILVASFGTLSTGVSVKSLSNVVFMESFKSEQIIIQSVGRILRLHKDKTIANVFDIVDIFHHKTLNNILYRHYLERKGFYEKRKYPFSELKINLN